VAKGFQNDIRAAMPCHPMAIPSPGRLFFSKRKARVCGRLISRAKIRVRTLALQAREARCRVHGKGAGLE
jgi:hypothetical protein